MTKSVCIIIAIVLIFHCAAVVSFAQEKPKVAESAKPAAKPNGGSVTVVEVRGSVEVRPSAKRPWVKAKPGMKLGSDWEISTGLQGRAVLRFEDNSTVVVQRLTEMKISEFSRTPGTVKTRLKMKYGAVRIQVKKGTAANDFKVSCPTATASVKGTEIKEFVLRGIGGRMRMGKEGKARYHVNPFLTLVAGQTTNDRLTSPIFFTKMGTWVPVHFSGYTREEINSSFWHGTVGAGIWNNLVPSHRTSPLPPNGCTNGNGDYPNGNHIVPW